MNVTDNNFPLVKSSKFIMHRLNNLPGSVFPYLKIIKMISAILNIYYKYTLLKILFQLHNFI